MHILNILAAGQTVLVWVAVLQPEESKSRRASAMKQKVLNSDTREFHPVWQEQRREYVNLHNFAFRL